MNSVQIDGTEYRFYDHLFAVSCCGEVLRKLTPYTPPVRPDGYLCAGRGRLVHRMVALCWLDKPESCNVVHHINGNRADNRADNLEWVTPKIHMAERHLGCRGKPYWPEESRERVRQFRTGRKDSPETARRKREILDAACPKRRCEIDGVPYRSIRQASLALNMHVSSVRWRCLSKNFPDYKLV